LRLFVAVNLPAAERDRIWKATGVLRNVSGVRWTVPDAYHVTIKFLGSAGADQVPAIVEALRSAARKVRPFDLSLGRFGAFPDWRRPRVFWVGAEAPGILALQPVVEEHIAPLGFPAEARPFHPHVTVGRARRDLAAGAAAGLARTADRIRFAARVHIGTVELMQSHTTLDGSRYSIVASAVLGNGEVEKTGA